MSDIINTSTLEFYNYGESNRLEPALGATYKVKVSDKDGNIITIEKDGALFAMVGLQFDGDTGILQLVDVAHDNSVLAEIEMPNADYIYNCRFDEETNSILFDVKSLYGSEQSTITLDVESLVELYEAGQGIEIGEKDEETGRKPISIKLAEGETLLQLSDDGLGLDDDVVTQDELDAAISGKADVEYVNNIFSAITGFSGDVTEILEEIEKIKDVIGTEEDDPNLDERIDSKADLDEFNDLENEVGELQAQVATISGDVESLQDAVDGLVVSIESNYGTGDEPDIFNFKQGENYIGTIEIQKEKYIESAKIVNDAQGVPNLVLVMNDGRTIAVKLTKVFDDYFAGNGIGIENHVVSIKLADDRENYLAVDENGLVTTGITEAIAAEAERAREVEEQLWGGINAEATRAQDVEAQLWGGINGEAARAQEVEGQLWSAIGAEGSRAQEVEAQLWNAVTAESEARQGADQALQAAIDNEAVLRAAADDELAQALETETGARENADEQLGNRIDAEAAAREEGDAAIAASIDAKVQAERERAEQKEAELNDAITAETRARENADEALQTAIEGEVARAQEVEQALNDNLNTLSGKVEGFEAALADETEARMNKDAEIDDALADIRNTYATVEYVDTKDADVKQEAITESEAYAKDYTDNEVEALENSLKQYVDEQDDEIKVDVDKNATKINVISNLLGVVDGDASNYDDSGNGILDVLHKEFHSLTDGISAADLNGLLANLISRIEALESRI